MTEVEVLEQLRCVVLHYPLWPGDTLMHELAYECARRGWIRRQVDGHWIPTNLGLEVYEQELKKKAKP